MKLNRRKIRISALGFTNIILFVFLAGAVLTPFAGTCSGSGDSSFVEAKTENPLENSEAVKGAQVLQNALRSIYREVNPAVVRIETEQVVKMQQHPFFQDPFFRRFFGQPGRGGQREQRRSGLGSGFVISKDGYVVTNHHVIRNVDKITVKLGNGKEYNGKVVGSDPNSDIALLKLEDADNLKVVHIGDSDAIEVGDLSIAIGNPFGLSSTFTLGVISSKGQDVSASDGIPRIQTDAAINPGNSGGPLLNIRGEVVGINQMIYSKSGGSVGIGFAIPINYAMAVLDKLKAGKDIKTGYIGVSIQPDPSEELLKELNVEGKTGLVVREVIPGAPAWNAGIRPYDFIVEVEGKKADKFSVLKSTVVRKGVGETIKLKVLRDGKPKNFSVKIAEAEDQNRR